jgi:hypothetical protein
VNPHPHPIELDTPSMKLYLFSRTPQS